MVNNNDDSSFVQELSEIKDQINQINTKVDLLLDILNNFTLLLSEEDEYEDEDEEVDYLGNESWDNTDDDFWDNDE